MLPPKRRHDHPKERYKKYCHHSDVQRTIIYVKKEKAKDEDNFLVIKTADGDIEDFQDKDDEYVKIVFWMSKRMRALFDKYGTVIMMDGTYTLEIHGYVLYTFMVNDRHYNKARLCAWALVSDEEAQTIRHIVRLFKEAIGGEEAAKKIKYAVVDKDRNEMAMIAEELYSGIIVVICRFHVIQAGNKRVDITKLPSHLQYVKTIIL